MHKPQHRREHGDDWLNHIRIGLPPYVADDWATLFQTLSVKCGKYNKTYNWDKSFRIAREQLSDSPHQKDCCGQQAEDRL